MIQLFRHADLSKQNIDHDELCGEETDNLQVDKNEFYTIKVLKAF